MKTGNGKTGRPISFDKDAALEAAMLLVWERGFEGTSMADLPGQWVSALKVFERNGNERLSDLSKLDMKIGRRESESAEAAEDAMDRVVLSLTGKERERTLLFQIGESL
jgi:hypothetical protein